MKRIILLLIFAVAVFPAFSQVINFAKTLPVTAFSITPAAVLNMSNGSYHYALRGPAFMLNAGYGIGYDVDMEVKYGYYTGWDYEKLDEVNHYFGLDVQYLFRETRNNYFSLHGGIHKWEEYGLDGTITFTHTPQYWLNLSAGLDIDMDISVVELRAWIPLNVGINFDDRYYIFLEYDLPATERSWDIIGLGITFIFR